jgi:hypothetical protein
MDTLASLLIALAIVFTGWLMFWVLNRSARRAGGDSPLPHGHVHGNEALSRGKRDGGPARPSSA